MQHFNATVSTKASLVSAMEVSYQSCGHESPIVRLLIWISVSMKPGRKEEKEKESDSNNIHCEHVQPLFHLTHWLSSLNQDCRGGFLELLGEPSTPNRWLQLQQLQLPCCQKLSAHCTSYCFKLPGNLMEPFSDYRPTHPSPVTILHLTWFVNCDVTSVPCMTTLAHHHHHKGQVSESSLLFLLIS